jgi:hypothetical protein
MDLEVSVAINREKTTQILTPRLKQTKLQDVLKARRHTVAPRVHHQTAPAALLCDPQSNHQNFEKLGQKLPHRYSVPFKEGRSHSFIVVYRPGPLRL